VDAPAGQTLPATIVLPPAGSVSGLVQGANAAAVPGVTVQISGQLVHQTTTTDSVGAYAFSNLAPDRYRLSVLSPNDGASATREIEVVVAEGAQVTQNVSLTATSSLSATITGPNGAVVGARVELSGPQYNDSRTSDPTGKVVFNNLGAGAYKVMVEPPAGSSLNGLKTDVMVAAGQVVQPVLNLLPAVGTVSGTVSFTGSQTGPVLVALFKAELGSSSFSYDKTVSNSSGRAAKKVTRGWAAIDETAVGTERPLFQVSIPAPGAFTFNGVPDGQYHVLAVMDLNGNGQVDPGEPVGKYGQPNAVFVAGGAPVAGVSFVLHLPMAGVELGKGLVLPQMAAPGGTVAVRVTATGADEVSAEVHDPSTGAVLSKAPLYDDGQHGDGYHE
jgi:uncharacterized protein (DUF2141 family)